MSNAKLSTLLFSLPLSAALLPLGAQTTTFSNADLVPTETSPMATLNAPLPADSTLGNGAAWNFAGVVANGNAALVVGSDPASANQVTLDGGTLNLEHARRSSANADNSVLYRLNSALDLNSGQIVFGAPSTIANRGFGDALGVRLRLDGNFTMNGGSIVSQPSSTASQFWLRGAQNTINAGSVVSKDITWVLNSSQTFRSAVDLGDVLIRTNGQTSYAIGHTDASGTLHLNSLQLHQERADRTLTLTLESNVTTQRRLLLGGGPSSGTTVYDIDTNGYTLDMSADANRWTPNAPGSTTNWNLKGDGEIRAQSFDFRTNNANVSVGANTSLRATGANATNFLDSATFNATSIFIYDAAGPGYISTTGAIGKLVVAQGQLYSGGGRNIDAAGGVVIEAGAGLGFRHGRLVNAPSYTFKVAGTQNGRIVFSNNYGIDNGVDAFNLTGHNFIVEIGEVITGDQIWALFDNGITLSGELGSLVIAGLYSINNFTREGSNLVGTDGQWRFVFSEITGELSVTNVVPEASTVSLVMGIAALGSLVLIRRRRTGAGK